MPKRKKKRKAKWTLRKWILLFYLVLSLLSLITTYLLAFLSLEALQDIPLTMLALLDAAFLGYLGADCLDHNSKNKYASKKQKEVGNDREIEEDDCQTRKIKPYIVREGDTLWSIAKEQLGRSSRYTEIVTLNGLKESSVSVGRLLFIPE